MLGFNINIYNAGDGTLPKRIKVQVPVKSIGLFRRHSGSINQDEVVT
jgi:hypothetical protein